MNFTVYCHTNLINGKSYIGWTSFSIEQRWRSHCRSAKLNSKFVFHAAIRKYGIDNWSHTVLEVHQTRENAKLAEMRLIAEYRTHCGQFPVHGYNMTLGGDGFIGNVNVRRGFNHPLFGVPKIHSVDAIERIRKAASNPTEEARSKMRAAARNRPPISDFTKEKLKRRNVKTHSKRIAKCSYEGDVLEIFDSVKSAALSMNKFHGNIASAARGNLKQAYGFQWKYID